MWPWVSRIALGLSSSAAARRLGVAGEEGIDQHRGVAVPQLEGRVAQKADLHVR